MSLTIFAQRMKQAREQKNMKQNELAKVVGVTPTTISAYEKSDNEGNGKKPTLENAQSIAKALGVSLDWLSGISNTTHTSFTDFTAKDYFCSLVMVLMETSSTFNDTLQSGITFNNPDIIHFLKKVNDLIKVYRAGSIPEDLFNVCVEKILDDFKNHTVVGNCLLDYSEADDLEQFLNDLFYLNNKNDVGFGECITSVSKHNVSENDRTVKILIDQKLINEYTEYSNIFETSTAFAKEGENNGNNNPKNE